MKGARSASSLEELIEADYNFHGTIIRASGNNVYISIYHTLRSFMHEEIKNTSMDDSASLVTLKEHQAIVNAIESGNEELTFSALNNHINSIKEQLKNTLKMDES